MKNISKIILIFTFINYSCIRSNYNDAISIYYKNETVLAELTKQMNIGKLYTRLQIKEKTLIEKFLTLNFGNEIFVSIEKIDVNYQFVSLDTNIELNKFHGIPELYFRKINFNYQTDDINSLYNILLFMHANNIEIVTMKTPEYSKIDLIIGFESALEYRIKDEVESDIKKSEKINDNWYFVEFK